ncbi:MAG: cupin domain-containing protein [Nitrososphaerota archaeon]
MGAKLKYSSTSTQESVDIWLNQFWEELFPGVYRCILAHNPTIMLMLVRMAPGAIVPRHKHIHLQAGILLEGSLLFKTESGERVLRKGESYLIKSFEPHEVENVGDEDAIALDIFTPRREDYLSAARPPDLNI